MAEAVPKSILRTIRERMGPAEDYDHFDTDLIININSAFSRLCQLGVGPSTPFKIAGEEELWTDFMPDGYLEDIKNYVYLKTKLIFDPPANTSVQNLYKEEIDKLEWLLREVSRDDY